MPWGGGSKSVHVLDSETGVGGESASEKIQVSVTGKVEPEGKQTRGVFGGPAESHCTGWGKNG